MRVLDEKLTQVQAFTDLYPIPKLLLDAASISNLSTIIPSSTQKTPPSYLFGSEPLHTWCYYFEKAELARQQQDYAQSYALIQQANQQGFYPRDLTEWYPYIASALRLGHFDEAAELSSRIIVNDSVVKYGVCQTWEGYFGNLPEGDAERVKAEDQFGLMECR